MGQAMGNRATTTSQSPGGAKQVFPNTPLPPLVQTLVVRTHRQRTRCARNPQHLCLPSKATVAAGSWLPAGKEGKQAHGKQTYAKDYHPHRIASPLSQGVALWTCNSCHQRPPQISLMTQTTINNPKTACEPPLDTRDTSSPARVQAIATGLVIIWKASSDARPTPAGFACNPDARFPRITATIACRTPQPGHGSASRLLIRQMWGT